MLFEPGYLSLFLASFLAATVVPFSSEVILSAMLASDYAALPCFIAATLGNWLGGMTSYYLGYLGKIEWIEKYLRVKHEKIITFQKKIDNKAYWISLFCWLPFIGDLIAIALGFMKANPFRTSIGMFIGKAARYIFIIWLTQYFIG